MGLIEYSWYVASYTDQPIVFTSQARQDGQNIFGYNILLVINFNKQPPRPPPTFAWTLLSAAYATLWHQSLREGELSVWQLLTFCGIRHKWWSNSGVNTYPLGHHFLNSFYVGTLFHHSLHTVRSDLSPMFHQRIWSSYFSRKFILYLFSCRDDPSDKTVQNEDSADLDNCSGSNAGKARRQSTASSR